MTIHYIGWFSLYFTQWGANYMQRNNDRSYDILHDQKASKRKPLNDYKWVVDFEMHLWRKYDFSTADKSIGHRSFYRHDYVAQRFARQLCKFLNFFFFVVIHSEQLYEQVNAPSDCLLRNALLFSFACITAYIVDGNNVSTFDYCEFFSLLLIAGVKPECYDK